MPREALSHQTLAELLRKAGRSHFEARWVWVRNFSDDGWVVFDVEEYVDGQGYEETSWRMNFTVSEDPMGVTLTGAPEKVQPSEEYAVAEGVHLSEAGRLIEAKETADGERVYSVVIIEAGMSSNGRLYEAGVLEAAVPLYEGAKAYDHHRTLDELNTSTIEGLIGNYENVAWSAKESAIVGDLRLLPSATHAKEALDRSIELQGEGKDPLIGISHDALADTAIVASEGASFEQVRHITKVLSSDVVADPAAGGRANRIVAGGNGDITPAKETPVDELKKLIAKYKGGTLTDEERDTLSGLLDSELGMSLEDLAEDVDEEPTVDDETTEEETADQLVGSTTEARTFESKSLEGKSIIRTALAEAKLPPALAENVRSRIPASFTEADLTNIIDPAKALAQGLEGEGITAGGGKVAATVTKDEADKLSEALDATFDPRSGGGFTSYKEMWAAFHPEASYRELESADFAYGFLREAYAGSRRMGESARVSEAIDTTTFAQVLGDSVARRMIAEYGLPQLQNWRSVVSNIETVNDFREQKRGRIGGYGTLPTVAEGAAYTPLTSPGDEEATYTVDKKGGTETLTMESIANDDLSALTRIPRSLGRAAAQTLYRFVWNLIASNPTMTYDATALFHASHGNLGTAALSAGSLQAARVAMREQAAYGDAAEVLGIAPSLLVVPAELEETAFELTRSAVAVTAGKDATVPNINSGMDMIVLPFLTDTNNWYAVGDPDLVPTIEVGFYRGRQDPELFVQDMGAVGSMFNTDEVTWKIRHIYSGTVLDHRGFYGGIVA